MNEPHSKVSRHCLFDKNCYGQDHHDQSYVFTYLGNVSTTCDLWAHGHTTNVWGVLEQILSFQSPRSHHGPANPRSIASPSTMAFIFSFHFPLLHHSFSHTCGFVLPCILASVKFSKLGQLSGKTMQIITNLLLCHIIAISEFSKWEGFTRNGGKHPLTIIKNNIMKTSAKKGFDHSLLGISFSLRILNFLSFI